MRCALLVLPLLLGGSLAHSPASAATVEPANAAQSQLEQRVLAQLAPVASRDGQMLSLTLDTQVKVRFHSVEHCTGAADCMVYRLSGLSPNGQFFVVEARGVESATRFWIARSTGKQYEVYAEPHTSPDLSYIVTANPAEFGSTNGVFLWEVSREGLIEQFRLEPAEYALYRFVRRSNPTTAELTKFSHADKAICPASQFMEIPARLARQNAKWTLDERANPKTVTCK